jgi:hypothetical protein
MGVVMCEGNSKDICAWSDVNFNLFFLLNSFEEGFVINFGI